MMPKVKAFLDQELARVAISDAAAAETAELILMMDLVTSGGEGLDALQGAAGNDHAAYFEFRDFFAPHIASALRAFAGRVLQSSEVYADGLVHIELNERRKPPSALIAFAGRLEWLTSEIGSLQDEYGQLYPADLEEFDRIRRTLDATDLLKPAQRVAAQDLWPLLETIYRHAQYGARIYRGDEEAIQAARATLAEMGERIDAKEREAVVRKAHALGAIKPQTQAEIDSALEELERLKQAAVEKRDRMRRATVTAEGEVRELAGRLADLAMASAEQPESKGRA